MCPRRANHRWSSLSQRTARPCSDTRRSRDADIGVLIVPQQCRDRVFVFFAIEQSLTAIHSGLLGPAIPLPTCSFFHEIASKRYRCQSFPERSRKGPHVHITCNNSATDAGNREIMERVHTGKWTDQSDREKDLLNARKRVDRREGGESWKAFAGRYLVRGMMDKTWVTILNLKNYRFPWFFTTREVQTYLLLQ